MIELYFIMLLVSIFHFHLQTMNCHYCHFHQFLQLLNIHVSSHDSNCDVLLSHVWQFTTVGEHLNILNHNFLCIFKPHSSPPISPHLPIWDKFTVSHDPRLWNTYNQGGVVEGMSGSGVWSNVFLSLNLTIPPPSPSTLSLLVP